MVFQVTEIQILTATNEAKNFLVVNLFSAEMIQNHFRCDCAALKLRGSKTNTAFVWKKCIHLIDCYIILAEMPFN